MRQARHERQIPGIRNAIVIGLTLAGLGILRADEPAAPKVTTPTPPSLSIENARNPEPGLVTAGQPTPEQFKEAARAGVRTIINLRAADEPGFEWEAELVRGLGLTYVHVPIRGADDLTRAIVERFDAALDTALAEGPALVHCASGNRVGAVLALRRGWLEGAPPEAALSFGVAAGLTKLESQTRALLEAPAPR